MGSKGQQMAVLFTTQLAEHCAVQNSLADIKWSFLLLEYSGHMRSAHLPSVTILRCGMLLKYCPQTVEIFVIYPCYTNDILLIYQLYIIISI